MKPGFPPFVRFCQTILEEDAYPGSTVIVDLDAHSYEDAPIVSWTFLNQGQHDYGLWSGILAITVICTASEQEVLLAHLYDQVHSWESLDKGELPGESLGVETVTDQSVFDIVNQANMNGKHLVQFTGSFNLIVRDFS